ncbi:hypothetical protein JHK84_040769 [Glycine max]|nr:hypothetical protein JHK84_040769 [Glycine max]
MGVVDGRNSAAFAEIKICDSSEEARGVGLCMAASQLCRQKMGKMTYKRLKGSQSFSQLLLSTLSSTPILIEDIRADETWPGLHKHDISLL